jgi:hypothetical protein
MLCYGSNLCKKTDHIKIPEDICNKTVHLRSSCTCTVPCLLPSYSVLCCWSSVFSACLWNDDGCGDAIQLRPYIYRTMLVTFHWSFGARRPVLDTSVYPPNNGHFKLSLHISHWNRYFSLEGNSLSAKQASYQSSGKPLFTEVFP